MQARCQSRQQTIRMTSVAIGPAAAPERRIRHYFGRSSATGLRGFRTRLHGMERRLEKRLRMHVLAVVAHRSIALLLK